MWASCGEGGKRRPQYPSHGMAPGTARTGKQLALPRLGDGPQAVLGGFTGGIHWEDLPLLQS